MDDMACDERLLRSTAVASATSELSETFKEDEGEVLESTREGACARPFANADDGEAAIAL